MKKKEGGLNLLDKVGRGKRANESHQYKGERKKTVHRKTQEIKSDQLLPEKRKKTTLNLILRGI